MKSNNEELTLSEAISHNLKYYRNRHRNSSIADSSGKISQERLAEEVLCSTQTIANIESGSQGISISLLERISEALNIPAWCFLTHETIHTEDIPENIK